ncbi:DNA-binding transcriptional activator GcvA [Roseovarius sp. THAF27]|nr:DNA-binding transcriptional activator GcvA [Roseovarius sp. THAF27]
MNHSIIHNAEPYRNRMQWKEWLSLQGHNLTLPETLTLNDYQLVIQACIAGEGIALGWSFTTQRLVDQGILLKPLDNEVVTDHAFYVLGPKYAELSRNKMRYINWISNHAA